MVLEGMKILVAEDEAINRLYLTHVLEGRGMRVVSVKDGQDAVAEAEKADRPDLILMDVSMPRMTGVEAASRIRATETEQGLKNVPIIALTAYHRADDRAECLKAGMNGFLSKPVHEINLWREIDKVLGENS